VNGEAGCLVCSQARVLKALFPVAKGYELKFYECAIAAAVCGLLPERPNPRRLSVRGEDLFAV
jgi:hypothetical protein